MAVMLVNFAPATRSIPAAPGKIIRVDRLLLCATQMLPGNNSVSLKNDTGALLAPPLMHAAAVDYPFPGEKPQGNRGQPLLLESSIENNGCYVWVEYHYVD